MQTLWYSMVMLPPGLFALLCPLKGRRNESKYTLNLSRQAAPCSLANDFPICRSHTIQKLLKPTNRKAAQQRTKLSIPYPVSPPDHSKSASSGNYLMKKHTISNKYNRELQWFYLQCKTNRVVISSPQNAACTGSIWLSRWQCRWGLRHLVFMTHHWTLAAAMSIIFQTCHSVHFQVSFSKQVSAIKNTPTHCLHKAPCCTEGLSFSSKSWNI